MCNTLWSVCNRVQTQLTLYILWVCWREACEAWEGGLESIYNSHCLWWEAVQLSGWPGIESPIPFLVLLHFIFAKTDLRVYPNTPYSCSMTTHPCIHHGCQSLQYLMHRSRCNYCTRDSEKCHQNSAPHHQHHQPPHLSPFHISSTISRFPLSIRATLKIVSSNSITVN